MKKIYLRGFVCFCLRLLATLSAVLSINSHAAMTINIYESGGNVIVDASGSLKIPSKDPNSLFTVVSSSIKPAPLTPNITFAGSTTLLNAGTASCTRQGSTNILFGTGTTTVSATSQTVNFPFLINLGNSPAIRFPSAVASGSIVSGISNSATYAGATFASLGVSPGITITCTYGSTTSDETIIISTGQAIPTVSDVSRTVGYNSNSNNIIMNSSGPPDSFTVSRAPTYGTVTSNGLNVIYTPPTNFYGTDTFRYTATNSLGTSTTDALVTIEVTAPTLVASPSAGALSAGTPGLAYTQTLSTSGGASPYTYAVTAGSLPSGLSLNTSTGVISGTPTTTGTASFTVRVTDSSINHIGTSRTRSTDYSISVSLASQSTLTVVPAATTINPNGTTSLTSSGGSGTGAVTYAVASGGCTVSGTTLTAPSNTGTCTVTATKAADSSYAAVTSAPITITVSAVPAPTVTATSPNTGTTAGGTSVTITGTDFTGATGVTIGGNPATHVTVVSATSITATTPAGTAGMASVVVTTPAGSNAANTLFTYVAPAPTVTAISPNTGTTAGGTSVTITGTNFTGVTGVTIGGAAATSVTVVSDTSITATTPAGTAGTASVVVTTSGGSNAGNGLFTYSAPSSRQPISEAAQDRSVLAMLDAQIVQSQQFVTTQIDNVSNHLSGYRSNFNLRPNKLGFGVNLNLPSIGPALQVLHKIKDELTPRSEITTLTPWSDRHGGSGLFPVSDFEVASHAHDDQHPPVGSKVHTQFNQEPSSNAALGASISHDPQDDRRYSVWTAGTIEFGKHNTHGDQETPYKLSSNGLTLGLDYQLRDSVIVGGALGVGTAWHNTAAMDNRLKGQQTAITAYGVSGLPDDWVVDGLVGYGVLDFSGHRTPTGGAARLGVERKGKAFFASGTLSKMSVLDGYQFTSFLRQDLIRIRLNSYAETGLNDHALGYDRTNATVTTTSAGLNVSRDIVVSGIRLTPSMRFALNRVIASGMTQDIYYADTGAAGGLYSMTQSGSYVTTQSLSLGLSHTTLGGDVFEFGWMGTTGPNRYRQNRMHLSLRFAM